MKSLFLRLHGWLGISAGLVIAVVGLTGAIMAFEPQILRVLNPGVLTIEPGQQALLPPDVLYARIVAAAPDKVVQTLTLSGNPERPAQVAFNKPGSPRGEQVWVQPYTGALLPKPRGDKFFKLVEETHKHLLIDSVGGTITGASALILLFMAFSGLYLRWSRRPGSWRGWLLMHRGLRGRAFLWRLHGVAGTWLLVFFVFSAGTGLSWSYDWYKAGVYRVLQVELPPRKKPMAMSLDAVSVADFSKLVQPAWATFRRDNADFGSASIALSAIAKGQVKIDYALGSASHDRERNMLTLDDQGQVVESKHFADKPWGERITLSWRMLHLGLYWGWVGQLVLFLSSLSLPVFAYTGIRLFIGRRSRRT